MGRETERGTPGWGGGGRPLSLHITTNMGKDVEFSPDFLIWKINKWLAKNDSTEHAFQSYLEARHRAGGRGERRDRDKDGDRGKRERRKHRTGSLAQRTGDAHEHRSVQGRKQGHKTAVLTSMILPKAFIAQRLTGNI